MAGASYQIELTGLEAAVGALRELQRRGERLYPAMDEIGGMMVASTQRRFELGIAPDGSPWKPSERARRQKGQTLVDSERLLDSVIHDPGDDAVEVGSNVVYAAIHQLGGQAGRGHAVTLPARPYLGVSADDQTEIVATLHRYLGGAVR